MNKRVFGLLFSLVFVVGCSTVWFPSHSQKVSKYISAHPELSENIRSALTNGIVVSGMNREEVLLCWGKPSVNKIEYIEGVWEENWSYFRRRGKTKTEESSSYWHMDIPSKRVTFVDGLVTQWKEYTDESTTVQNTEQKKSAPLTQVSHKEPVKPEVEKAPVFALPTKASFSDWPHLTVNGVVTKGNNGSAIINRALLDQGDIIEDVKLISVNENGVWLEYNGVTQFLSKGHSTWE